MRTDRELLELAAKAAGLEFHWIRLDSGWLMQASEPGSRSEESWNPLVNDGDALRLAMKLHIDISSYKESGNVHAHSKHSLGVGPGGYHSYQAHEVMTEALGADPIAATRRAIVRAAAEIGTHPKQHNDGGADE